MPQQRQEKELLTLNEEKRKMAIPGEDASLSLIAWHSRVAAHRLGNCLKAWALPKRGCCLWVTPTAAAGQPWHFQPRWPGGWVRPSPAPILPSRLVESRDQPSAAVAHGRAIKKNNKKRSNFSWVAFACPIQLSIAAFILSIFSPSGPCCFGYPSHHLFPSLQAEITGGFCKVEMLTLLLGGRREKLHRNRAETVPSKTRMPTEWRP